MTRILIRIIFEFTEGKYLPIRHYSCASYKVIFQSGEDYIDQDVGFPVTVVTLYDIKAFLILSFCSKK